jgi:hypothetical protein
MTKKISKSRVPNNLLPLLLLLPKTLAPVLLFEIVHFPRLDEEQKAVIFFTKSAVFQLKTTSIFGLVNSQEIQHPKISSLSEFDFFRLHRRGGFASSSQVVELMLSLKF